MVAVADPTTVLGQVPMWAAVLLGVTALASWLPPIRNPISGAGEGLGAAVLLILLATTLTGRAGLVTAATVILAITEVVLLALSGPDLLRRLRRQHRPTDAAVRPAVGPGRHRVP